MTAAPRSAEQLVADLRRLGVDAGDLVMVHASLRALGAVTGGADGVLDALGEALGPTGTLLLMIGPGEGIGAFDALRTPVDPDVGVLAEVFRSRQGTLVSNHPEGRMGASGPLPPGSSPTCRGTTTTGRGPRSNASSTTAGASFASGPISTP